MADAPSPAPYDDWADLYDKVYAYLDYDLDFWLGQANAAGGPVLEMGCGTGRVALALADAGFDVTGVDISPRMIEQAKAKAKTRGLADRSTFIVADMAEKDPGANADFGLVLFPFRSSSLPLLPSDPHRPRQEERPSFQPYLLSPHSEHRRRQRRLHRPPPLLRSLLLPLPSRRAAVPQRQRPGLRRVCPGVAAVHIEAPHYVPLHPV